MAGPFELKKLWGRYREYRVTKKQMASQTSSESSSRNSTESAALDEATALVVGMGLDTKQEEKYVEYALNDDPRFINNPHGIGCSRTYELTYDSVANSLSTSPASTRPPLPREINVNETDERLSWPELGAWKAESIDTAKGKRKGRMPNDSVDDQYKFLLDGPASRTRFSAKRLG